ncbi:hypothetical protein ILYODFUR_012842 [Ilyodon furcidens]|uniref:Secreted protein n=1 Tax=Ilyodon furcidens TaxID=33524 RepID=A0ABV0SWS1_9TELE
MLTTYMKQFVKKTMSIQCASFVCFSLSTCLKLIRYWGAARDVAVVFDSYTKPPVLVRVPTLRPVFPLSPPHFLSAYFKEKQKQTKATSATKNNSRQTKTICLKIQTVSQVW